MVDEEYISIRRLAERLGMDRSHARRYVLKLGIKPLRRRTPDSRNQPTLTVTHTQAELVLRHRTEQGFLAQPAAPVPESGVFYVIQLVPELDPKRVKLGFAADIGERLAQHRTAAPTARVVHAWPCKRSWELTAMDALTASGCRLILNEVFEVDDVQGLVARGDTLFALLPNPKAKQALAAHSPFHEPAAAVGDGQQGERET